MKKIILTILCIFLTEKIAAAGQNDGVLSKMAGAIGGLQEIPGGLAKVVDDANNKIKASIDNAQGVLTQVGDAAVAKIQVVVADAIQNAKKEARKEIDYFNEKARTTLTTALFNVFGLSVIGLAAYKALMETKDITKMISIIALALTGGGGLSYFLKVF